jgi:hypothetical protein
MPGILKSEFLRLSSGTTLGIVWGTGGAYDGAFRASIFGIGQVAGPILATAVTTAQSGYGKAILMSS